MSTQRITELGIALRKVVSEFAKDENLAGALTQLEDMREIIEAAEAEIKHTVSFARQCGYSWAQIGAALGVSKQAAQQRYGKK